MGYGELLDKTKGDIRAILGLNNNLAGMQTRRFSLRWFPSWRFYAQWRPITQWGFVAGTFPHDSGELNHDTQIEKGVALYMGHHVYFGAKWFKGAHIVSL